MGGGSALGPIGGDEYVDYRVLEACPHRRCGGRGGAGDSLQDFEFAADDSRRPWTAAVTRQGPKQQSYVARDCTGGMSGRAAGLHRDEAQMSKHYPKVVLGRRVGEERANGPACKLPRVRLADAGVGATGVAPGDRRGVFAHRHELECDWIARCCARAACVESSVSMLGVVTVAI